MSDRDLLEAAARAAGLSLTWGEKYKVGDDEIDCTDIPYAQGASPDESPFHWNPIVDDGDALRLAVGRRFSVRIFSASDGEIPTPGFVEVWREDDDDPLHVEYVESGDYTAATRRAIVRAAAALTQPEGGA